ncbi:hypothetical protein [Bradyrhizobium sp. MOS002]|uniref:hypothetical protein n=1 Tax=Bradyrhizobium sp. MOS002 TaxID=2133947 RepID=UPI0018ECBFEA|nr:hypothetical protein [Bradyrhizobium sp. MOS002]
MTEKVHMQNERRNRLLEVANQELARFERQESEFRKKDRKERAAELKLPLDKIELH